LEDTQYQGGRRALLKSFGLASVGTAAAALMPLSKAVAASTPGADSAVTAEEYWVYKGEGAQKVKLWVYRKYVKSAPSDTPKKLLFLVHGSSYSAKTMYDLQVPNRINYSMMDYFARLGFDVWTMDHEGYGHSDRTSGFSYIADGVVDLKAAMAEVTKHTGQTKAAFFGQSSGSLRAGLFAATYPEHVSMLVLDAFTWTGGESKTLEQRKKMLPGLLKSNTRKVDAKFFRGVFTRDEVGAAEPMISDLVSDAELKYGDTVPNGTYIDMVTKLPIVDPLKVVCPVQIIRGQHDGIASDDDVIGFYAKLPNPDKQLIKIAGLAHTAMLGVNRTRFLMAVQEFVTMPAPIDIGAKD
jgi:pimeloyl-ACP methyl ester carboxylesterase